MRTVEFCWTKADADFDNLSYLFPGREFVLSTASCSIQCPYSFLWPASFVTVMNEKKNKAVTLIATKGIQGLILAKNAEELKIVFQFESLEGDVLSLYHTASIDAAIKAYRSYYQSHFGSLPAMNGALKKCFRVRRYFFNQDLCQCHILNESSNKKTTVHFEDWYQDDCKTIGEVDAALLFDYAYDPSTQIRCGNAEPFPKGSEWIKELNRQISHVKAEGCNLIFAYLDPYLIQDGSDWDWKFRDTLPLKDKDRNFIRVWDKSQWHPDINKPIWQETTRNYLDKVCKALDVNGIYLDEMGNGTQFQDDAHLAQIQWEINYTQFMKEAFPEKIFMCEFAPVDSMNHSYQIVLSDTRTTVNIYRFLFPEIRFIRIIGCDRPIGDNVREINKSFFNGEGLWIDNDLHDGKWYSPQVIKTIKEQYQVMQKYYEFFSSDQVSPCCGKADSEILVNRFGCGNRNLYTFFNAGAEYYTMAFPCTGMTINVFSGKPEVVKHGEIEISLESGGVTAIVMEDKQ